MTREVVLETPRLVVTTWEPGDVDDLYAVHSDPLTMRFVRHGRPESRDEVVALVAAYIAEQEETGVTKWRVVTSEGRFAGRAGFGGFGDGRELGFTLHRDLWGQGLATELATALVAWHCRYAAPLPLWGFASAANHASRRVLTKVGFLRQGNTEFYGETCPLYRCGSKNEGA